MNARSTIQLTNVTYDPNSDHSWNSLNERDFLMSVFHELQPLLGTQFWDYNFYIYSGNSSKKPASYALRLEKKVLIWISDEAGTDPTPLLDGYSFIFKSYLKKENLSLNILSFPLGTVKDVPAIVGPALNNRRVNIFLVAI